MLSLICVVRANPSLPSCVSRPDNGGMDSHLFNARFAASPPLHAFESLTPDLVMDALASVGLSSTATSGMRGLVGMTHCYAPPEIHFDPENARATKKADVFSLGLLVFELCTGKVPYPAQRSSLGSTTIPPPLQQWLRAAWAESPDDRPTMQASFEVLHQLEKLLTPDDNQILGRELQELDLLAKSIALRSATKITVTTARLSSEGPTNSSDKVPTSPHSPDAGPGGDARGHAAVASMTHAELVAYLTQTNWHRTIVALVESEEVDGSMLLDRDIAAIIETELAKKNVPNLHIQKWRKFVESIADSAS